MTSSINTKRLLLTTLYLIWVSLLLCQSTLYEPNELLVKWKATTKIFQPTALKTEIGIQNIEKIATLNVERWEIVDYQTLTVLDLVKKYQNHPAIEWIETYYICTTMGAHPNDPEFEAL